MLTLKNISKIYRTGDETVQALNGVNVTFRKSEFVCILGHSGCGKTTLLNIIGGLDQYTHGDLVINGKSTKAFNDRDWDSYRNHSVGFVFQSYNLIEHQSVLSNVELALTLSGVSKTERRKRAADALIRVGLGDQLHKKPNQMSGGQMQRVAIARALVNDPEILLADEPTGALDSETSVQIMEILKDVAKNRLVVMVTHNPELADRYATRIVRLLDGSITDDTLPCEQDSGDLPAAEHGSDPGTRGGRTSMSFLTALSLSLNNLLTKKTRTLLTSFAGSIGIIGIALILAISTGIDAYINRVEEDTLSGYPIQIQETTVNMSELLANMSGEHTGETEHGKDKIYSNNIMTDMINVTTSNLSRNNLEAFKNHLEQDGSTIDPLVSGIKYQYTTQLNVYKADTGKGVVQVNPSTVFEKMGMSADRMSMSSTMPGMDMSSGVWQELLDNEELISKQYDVLAGRMPQSYDELVIIADENNEISDFTLYSLGLKDVNQLPQMMADIAAGKTVENEQSSYTYDELLALEFKLLLNPDYYVEEDGVFVDKSDDTEYMTNRLDTAQTLKVVGVLRPNDEAVASAASEGVGYTAALMQHLITEVNKSPLVKRQQENEAVDMFTGNRFTTEEDRKLSEEPLTMEAINEYLATLAPEESAEYTAAISQMQAMGMPEEQIIDVFEKARRENMTDATYDGNLQKLGVSDLDKPSAILIYARDFAAKEQISDLITEYNSSVAEEDKIDYTDYIGLLMSSVTTIINAISYVLIAFVAISLIVSSIMIGIITYISVLERTKEIGILRAIGASKRDISRVFNAETLIIGLTAGAIGIGLTLLLTLPINAVILSLTDIAGVAKLPVAGAVILVIISMLLTLISGLIPARIAAKKDPVEALRSE